MHKNLKIGWIGLGVMGAPMCSHLLAAGYPVSVYTRSRHRAEPLLKAGARWCESPRDVAGDADVVSDIYRKRIINRGAAALNWGVNFDNNLRAPQPVKGKVSTTEG